MVERIDTWLGKALFVPLIIRLCQRLRISQHAFNRMCWFSTFLVALYCADNLWRKIVFGAFALLACLVAALIPDHIEETSSRWFRMLVISTTLLMMPKWLSKGPDYLVAYNLLILFAEYATTIRTIPPLENKSAEPIRKVQEQSA